MANVPASTCTRIACILPEAWKKPCAAQRPTNSLGAVMNFRSVMPESSRAEMASIMAGWSEPRFTKRCVTPAETRASSRAVEVV